MRAWVCASAITAIAALAPHAAAQKATAGAPASCWRYATPAEGVGSRFGIKGDVNDAVLSRAAYYNLTSRKVTTQAPFMGTTSVWLKLELRAEAKGPDGPLALSGMMV